jgi:hypothetical protein
MELDPIERPSSQRGLLRDNHCSNQKSDDPGPRSKKKKDSGCSNQDAASDE